MCREGAEYLLWTRCGPAVDPLWTRSVDAVLVNCEGVLLVDGPHCGTPPDWTKLFPNESIIHLPQTS